jgi:nucleotide-binding universal stress UspA family protein
MELRHIVVATDESDAGRGAVRAGVELAGRASANVTVMRTLPIPAVPVFVAVRGGSDSFSDASGAEVEVDRLWAWIAADLPARDDRPPVAVAVTYGFPGVEICRFAEDEGADLLVLGRKQRSSATRMLLGDTADSVARRSRVPCLFVTAEARPIRRILVALDGTERGMRVLIAACKFATNIGAELRMVTVERPPAGESMDLGRELPLGRTTRLEAEVHAALGAAQPDTKVDIRRGAIVPQVLAAVKDHDADALVIGYHRGGPPGPIEAGSTARRLAHTAPCAVLSIPL